MLQAKLCALASGRHCGGFHEAELSNTVAATWLLSSWSVRGPAEGHLCSGRYFRSSSRELSGSPSFRMSPDSIVSGCSCSSPSTGRLSASDPKGLLDQRSASSFRFGHLHHLHTCCPISVPLQSASMYLCRVSEQQHLPLQTPLGSFCPLGIW